MHTSDHAGKENATAADHLRRRIAELESQNAAYRQDLEVLQAREQSAHQFQDKLKILNEISIDLDQTGSFDDLCRLAIELGCSRLGFDRLSLWFLDETRDYMVGSFGIDESGQIRDERDQRFRVDVSSMLVGIAARKIEVSVQDNADLLNDRSEVVGRGWNAAARLWDGDSVIGFISTDNLLSGQPRQEYQVELLRVYGATVAYLAKSKRAEQQVRKLSRAIDSSPSIVMITDRAGNIEYVNPKFTLVTGYTTEEVIGKNPRFLQSGDTSASEYETLWQTILRGDEWRGEFRNRRKNGEHYWALSSISAVKNPEGEITNFVAVQEDITELKMAQQHSLELAVEREKVQILSDFIADIAHEFKTPLSIINTGVYLLERTASEDDLAHLNAIKQQSSDINVLLDAMLTMARLDSSDVKSLRPLELSILICSEIDSLESLAHEKGVTLSCHLEALPVIMGNADHLLRAIAEILTNAIQYTPPGGEVSVLAHARENRVIIEVIDSGMGMSEEELPHIFDRFYRVDKARTVRGAGLGLSIARKAIEFHSGHIEVRSAVGKGSTFRIILPQATE